MRLGSTLICRFVRSTSSHRRPWQIALAVTAGILLGILPKTSLLIALVGLICFVIPAHLPLLVMTAVLVSLAEPLLESTLGRIGLWSLTHPNLNAYWMRLDSLPLVPWLGIHNTVVNGGLVTWIIASVPVYICSLVVSRVLIDESLTDEVADIVFSAEVSPVVNDDELAHEIRPLTGLREPGLARTPIEPPVVIWDDINHDRSYFESDSDSEMPVAAEVTSSEHVIRRAADMAAWAEELISEELLMDERNDSIHRAATVSSNPSGGTADAEERWLIETTLEMVRIAEQAVTNQAAMKAKQAGDTMTVASTDPSIQESSEIQTAQSQSSAAPTENKSATPDSNIRREQLPHTDHRNHLGHVRSGVANGATGGVVNRPREEALHYLLRHLKGVQEKAQKQ